MKLNWTSSAVIALLFFAALWTPLIGTFFGTGEFQYGYENRILAPIPKLSLRPADWLKFGASFTGSFHDHFGFRGALITAQALVKVKLLGVSSSREVLLGKDGWLFYSGEKSLENHCGAWPFAEEEKKKWVELFRRRDEWLSRRGILMILAIAPDKESIYPEHLPKSRCKVQGPTRMDEFLEAMRTAQNVRVVDLRHALRNAKAQGALVFHRTDAHWNSAGVHAAYMAILREIAQKYPDVEPTPIFDKFDDRKAVAGDLADAGIGQRLARCHRTSPAWAIAEYGYARGKLGHVEVECSKPAAAQNWSYTSGA